MKYLLCDSLPNYRQSIILPAYRNNSTDKSISVVEKLHYSVTNLPPVLSSLADTGLSQFILPGHLFLKICPHLLAFRVSQQHKPEISKPWGSFFKTVHWYTRQRERKSTGDGLCVLGLGT